MDDIGTMGREYGWLGAIALWLLVKGYAQFQTWLSRRWTKEDKVEIRRQTRADSAEAKMHELYDRLFEQDREMLGIIHRNAEALEDNKASIDQLRTALEAEIPPLVLSVRELIQRVTRRIVDVHHSDN